MDDATEALRIEVSRPFAHVVLVVLTGEIDIMSSVDLAERLAVVATEPSVVIDLAEVTFIDSSGLNVLVQGVRHVERNGGAAMLAAPSLLVRRVFEIARLEDVVPIEQSRDEALARCVPVAAPPCTTGDAS